MKRKPTPRYTEEQNEWLFNRFTKEEVRQLQPKQAQTSVLISQFNKKFDTNKSNLAIYTHLKRLHGIKAWAGNRGKILTTPLGIIPEENITSLTEESKLPVQKEKLEKKTISPIKLLDEEVVVFHHIKTNTLFVIDDQGMQRKIKVMNI